jgi:uncharacterized protein YbbC (DUF1343 family)/CubicO group peptidase (beta-lactamase class C family)
VERRAICEVKAVHTRCRCLLARVRSLPLLFVLAFRVLAAADTLDRATLARMDAEITHAVALGRLPGGVLWVEHAGEHYCKAFGERALKPVAEPMTKDTLFDAASLTKVLATTPAIMILYERGQLKIDEPAQTYLPEFAANGKENITLRHLLTHTSGLRAGLGGPPSLTNYSEAIRLACAEKPATSPGTAFRYSDINFIVLGEIVRRVSGTNLDAFASREIFAPLQMEDTGYLPPASKRSRVAPTENVGGQILRGTVHDPTARRMGGVAGHAGVFSTAADLARFARMMLQGGELDGVRILKAATVKLMTCVQSPDTVPSRRGLGWDIDSGYSGPRGEAFPLGSYGHTGFTGTSLWIDPFSGTFVIFLSNSVHPTGKGNVLPLRKTLGTLAACAIGGFDFSYVDGALLPRPAGKPGSSSPATPDPETGDAPSVRNGIDVLARQGFAPLKDLRLGLITNHTGRDRHRNSTLDLLLRAQSVQLKALFPPEHGLRGLMDEAVPDSTDPVTGLPVFSLYGTNRAPTAAQLQGLDALVFDIQDIGCRFYTYISTMGLAMEAAARAHIKFFVLDRVNPINGLTFDGPVLTGDTSFVAYHAIPVRHGMTVGELAQMFKAERKLDLDLTVVPLDGWSRKAFFDETGLPWANPSPNMRSLNEAILYPGVGLLEFMQLSVGRGTGTPFEVVGAPYIDDLRLARELNAAGLEGVGFVPVRFTPAGYVFKGTNCGGVNILITDRERCKVVDLGIVLAQTLHRLYPDQIDLEKLQRLLGHRPTIDAIKAGKPLVEIRKLWTDDLEKFAQRREAFLLYK